MSIQFEYIDSFLAAKDLKNPELKLLMADANQYKTLAYQHYGEIESSTGEEKFIRNRDRELAISKFNSYFQKAIDERVELAVTPEYACPWESIEFILENNKLPLEGNLWIIGCESITPIEFREFVENNNESSLYLIFEPEAYGNTDNKFLDPILYFFKTKHLVTNETVDVLVFQFKTHPMGGIPIEAEFLIQGTKRYIIRNDEESIYLATVICSESLALDGPTYSLRQFADKPYLLVHLQLNKSPRVNNFKKYRTTYFNACELNSKKDYICLNWARNTKIGDERIDYSHSGIYTKSTRIITDDDKINHNDNLGLFFHRWSDAYASIFLFHPDEMLFLFFNYKVSQGGLPVQNHTRYGPQMIIAYKWVNNSWNNNTDVWNTDLVASCREIGSSFDFFLNTLTSINRERILSLSTGLINSTDWAHPIYNTLFKVADDEMSNRINLFQDPATQDIKKQLLNRFNTLISLFNNSRRIPNDSQLTDLKTGCRLSYEVSQPHNNVVSNINIPACLIYAGDITEAQALALFDIVSESITDEIVNKRKRILIWYNKNGRTISLYDKEPPRCTDKSSANPKSFRRTTE